MEFNASQEPASYEILGRKAWTNYASLMLAVLLGSGMLYALAIMVNEYLAIVLGICFAGLIVHSALWVRNYRIFCDQHGVWEFRGVFPWEKGIRGVKWRDLDEAVVVSTMWGYILKSHTVRVRNRYKPGFELCPNQMENGPAISAMINARHLEYIKSNSL